MSEEKKKYSDFNRFTVVGNLVEPPAQIPSPKGMVALRIANHRTNGAGEFTNFLRVVGFGKTAESVLAMGLERGQKIEVTGEIRTRKTGEGEEAREEISLVAFKVDRWSPKKGPSDPASGSAAKPAPQKPTAGAAVPRLYRRPPPRPSQQRPAAQAKSPSDPTERW